MTTIKKIFSFTTLFFTILILSVSIPVTAASLDTITDKTPIESCVEITNDDELTLFYIYKDPDSTCKTIYMDGEEMVQ